MMCNTFFLDLKTGIWNGKKKKKKHVFWVFIESNMFYSDFRKLQERLKIFACGAVKTL